MSGAFSPRSHFETACGLTWTALAMSVWVKPDFFSAVADSISEVLQVHRLREQVKGVSRGRKDESWISEIFLRGRPGLRRCSFSEGVRSLPYPSSDR